MSSFTLFRYDHETTQRDEIDLMSVTQTNTHDEIRHWVVINSTTKIYDTQSYFIVKTFDQRTIITHPPPNNCQTHYNPFLKIQFMARHGYEMSTKEKNWISLLDFHNKLRAFRLPTSCQGRKPRSGGRVELPAGGGYVSGAPCHQQRCIMHRQPDH